MSLHPGHKELLRSVGVTVLFSYTDKDGLWHVRMEVVDFDGDQPMVTFYSQGGPPEEAPDTNKEIADALPLEDAKTALALFAAVLQARLDVSAP